MTYDKAFFDTVIDRTGTRCVKWDDKKMCGPDDLPMWVADWDFRCAEPIVKAIQARAHHPVYGYSCADPKDAQAFCDFWQRRHDVTILPAQTCMLPCVVTGLRQAVLNFTAPGEGVIIMTPLYPPFHDAITRSGRRIAAAPLLRDEKGAFSIDLAAVEQQLQSGVKLILFCNPHNPISRVWRREELARMVALSNQYGAVLVSDEIHADFVYRPLRFTSMLSIPGAEKCVLMFASASKTFNLPGLQQATAVSLNENLLQKIKTSIDVQGITAGNTFALLATQAAYTACDDWLDGMLAYLEESRDILTAEIPRQLPRAVLSPIEATALCWLDLRAYAPTCAALEERLRAKHLVLNAGNMFDKTLGEGFMRLNFACPHAMLREGIRRLAAALETE